jgi:acetyl-CoA/propionyl-CoA carboxylase biotin carboxyl carrier protein
VFESILVANRGEVAVRIIRAVREMGLRSIAVHSQADAGALWTRIADEAHEIGAAAPRESYLNIERIVEVGRAARASAVHPGYGLLSENPQFARAVADAGMSFIGPSPEAIGLMGDKVAARAAALACNVRVLSGSDGPIDNAAEALNIAKRVGWPVAVKASFGGGGRGMRIAVSEHELSEAIEQARREAASAFGRAEVFIERFLPHARHVEVQVLGDRAGNLLHLGDRDCSVQRRYQKLIEEAPAPDLSSSLRARLARAALTLCRSVGYHSAGTVEFLVDVASEEFYFLEMNTRLQVEHGVTELVTGIDIVQQQIRIAAGEPLGMTQDEVAVTGHAMQARIAAENPWLGFRPAAGKIEYLGLPAGPWLRSDFGFESGDTVPQYYDSMLGKIQAYGRTREEARIRLGKALDALRIDGPPTTASYLSLVLRRPSFIDAVHDTGSLERDWASELLSSESLTTQNAGGKPHEDNGEKASTLSERKVAVPWGGELIDVAVYGVLSAASGTAISHRGSESGDRRSSTGSAAARDGVLRAPMDAVVVARVAEVGSHVARGAAVMVLEAMKMEVIIQAANDGTLEEYFVAAGDTVKTGAKLASVGVKAQ